MADLQVSIVIYATRSSDASECHVALAVAKDSKHFYLYHATEEPFIKNEMKFERIFREVDPLLTGRRHHVLSVKGPIANAQFDKLNKALSDTPVPRPKPEGWNCQTWLRRALEMLEKEGLVNDVEPPVSKSGTIIPRC